jgi:signal transduction histidine kinase/CheY-like chemotaxis protein
VLEGASSWVIPPAILVSALVFAAAVLGIWLARERRMAAQRKRIKVLNTLAEEVFTSANPTDMLRKLMTALPKVTGASRIGLYLYNRGTRALEGVHTGTVLGGPLMGAVSGCFADKALVAIPDTRRSTLFQPEERKELPKSLMFVPMPAQGETLGVLSLEYLSDAHFFTHEEQAAMQHLANQMGTALKLQDQQSVREQLFRSEKLAAAGQLISGVANELRSPLESIVNLAAGRADLNAIALEARRASDIVGRLVSFARAEQSEASAVDLNAVLQGLGRFREPEWKGKGIQARLNIAPHPVVVLGSRTQLEQVFLNLLLEAEQFALESHEKTLAVTSSVLAKRALVEISYPVRAGETKAGNAPEGETTPGALSLGVCEGLIQSHGGEIRLVRPSSHEGRFEVDLPAVETRADEPIPSVETRMRARELTVLVVEPDARIQKELTALLAGRGDRVVPVSSAEEGADLAARIRFDMTLCAVRLPGLNWVEFFERVRHQVGSFVLLTEGYDADLARAFQGGEGYVLSKPVDAGELLRICETVGERAAV